MSSAFRALLRGVRALPPGLRAGPNATSGPLRLLAVMLAVGLALHGPTRAAAAEADEDPDRVSATWRSALSPADYLRALQVTRQRAASRTTATTGFGVWTSAGPTGDPIATTEMPAPAHENNGRIRSIQIRAEDGGYAIYVGATSGGLWRAFSGTGPVWTSLGDRLPNPSVGAFAVHPAIGTDILVGTGDYNRYGGAGLFHTTDGGLSWSTVTLPAMPTSFFKIHYHPNNANIVLAASSAGLFRSVSGPVGPWTVVLSGMVTDLVMHPSDPDIQYCCRATTDDDGGVYKSMDGGASWMLITAGYAPTGAIGHARIALCQSQPANLLFVYENGNVVSGLLKSSDSGAHWTPLGGAPIGGGQAFHALAAAIHPNDPNTIFVGANQLWYSTTGGSSWTDIVNTATHQDQTQLFFSPLSGSNLMWICNDGGLHSLVANPSVVPPAQSWNGNASTGLSISTIDYMDARRDLLVIGRQDDGNLSSDNGGASWRLHSCCDGFGVAISDDLNPTSTFWFSQNGSVFRQPLLGARQSKSYTSGLSQLFYDRLSDRIFSIFGGGALTQVLNRPADGSGAWVDDGSGVPNGLGGLSGSYLNGQTLYAWVSNVITVLQKSGASWTVQSAKSLPNAVQTVFASTERPFEAWAGLAGIANTPKLAHTTDGWATWTDISGTLASLGGVKGITVVPFKSSEIYVATDIGVFQSLDAGATWQPFQTGLPIVDCHSIRYLVDRTHAGNDRLVVATYGRGVYEYTIPQLPLVYVDPRNAGSFQDGSFEHAYKLFASGLAATPAGGILALHGGSYTTPSLFTTPMFLNAFDSPATLSP